MDEFLNTSFGIDEKGMPPVGDLQGAFGGMGMKENTKESKKQLPLRLSPSLYAELMRWADEDFRSLNGQIEYLLTVCVKKRRGETKNG